MLLIETHSYVPEIGTFLEIVCMKSFTTVVIIIIAEIVVLIKYAAVF